MSSTEIVTLLGKTEGRDKLLKAAAGLAKAVAFYTNSKQHAQLASSLSESRSILRLAGWINNIKKFMTLPTETGADRLMIARVAFDMFYCIHDNLAYLVKYKALGLAPYETLVARGFIGIFWGFFCAVLLDIHALTTKTLSSQEFRKRALMLVRNLCDLFAGLHNVGYAKNYGFNLNAPTLGILGLVSGAISTQENLEACKK